MKDEYELIPDCAVFTRRFMLSSLASHFHVFCFESLSRGILVREYPKGLPASAMIKSPVQLTSASKPYPVDILVRKENL